MEQSGQRCHGCPPWQEYFVGRIDEVRIYARALSESEIAADMDRPVGAPQSD